MTYSLGNVVTVRHILERTGKFLLCDTKSGGERGIWDTRIEVVYLRNHPGDGKPYERFPLSAEDHPDVAEFPYVVHVPHSRAQAKREARQHMDEAIAATAKASQTPARVVTADRG
jgi:hypothetical protein